MMPVVYLVLVLVAVYVFSLPRAVDGLTFYLRPDWAVSAFTFICNIHIH
jgi:SNF family Na+-dependent transporter